MAISKRVFTRVFICLFSNIRFMSQTYWKRMLASARGSIWVHFKNDMRPDRLRDERSHGKTNKTQQNATIQIRMEGEIQGEEEMKKKRGVEEQFSVNFFGSKSQPNVPVSEWGDGESAERSFTAMAAWMDGWEGAAWDNKLLKKKLKKVARCFPGITTYGSRRHC